MEKPQVSVALATFNEEKNLPGCLDSVKGLAAEIIIADGGSTDKTVSVARKYGAQVIATTNKPIFHLNKQMAIDACREDWILQLDADEQLTPELRKEVRGMTRETKYDGFWIPRKNWFLDRYLTKGGQYPDYTLRLYRRGKGKLPCQSVHEQAVVAGKVGYLKNDLLHNADPNFSRYLLRFDRYTSLMADEMESGNFIDYFIFKPAAWFLATYFRHRGYVDGFPGFVFSLFSSLRFPVAYIKYWEKKHAVKQA